MSQNDRKREVAYVAAKLAQSLLRDDDVLGVGTGSTVDFFIETLGRQKVHIHGAFSSSDRTSRQLEEIGVNVLDTNSGRRAALYVDGADEVDPHGALIKGGGGALTREKIVASLSDQFICLVDESKMVEQLGTFPLPVEVIPMAMANFAERIEAIGGTARLREGFTTDNGNVILDVLDIDLSKPALVENTLNNIAGVVENGIFWTQRPDLVLVGAKQGVRAHGQPNALERYAPHLDASVTTVIKEQV